MLPRRTTVRQRRDMRWRSPAHCTWVRGFDCCNCGSSTNVVAAHYRLGSHTGMGQKPDDWLTVPLCDGPNSDINGQLGCHKRQHIRGEVSFWNEYAETHGQTVDQLLDELSKCSPKGAEIRKVKKERGDD